MTQHLYLRAKRDGLFVLEEKYRRELESMKYICDELLKPISEQIAKEFMGLWEEYETGETKEAIFVKDGQFLSTLLCKCLVLTRSEIFFSRPIRINLPNRRIREEISSPEGFERVSPCQGEHQERICAKMGRGCA